MKSREYPINSLCDTRLKVMGEFQSPTGLQ